MERQSDRLFHCENTSDLCLQELQTAQNQVQTLQAKIRISEDRNRLLQKRLGEMEVELRVVREEAQNQERSLQNLTDSLSCKEQEVFDLLRVVEEQNRALCSGHKQDSSPHFLELLKEQNDVIKALRSGLNSDQDQNQVWILKEQLKKTQDLQEQELVSELQRLRGRLRADFGPDRRLILGLDAQDEAPEAGGAVLDLGYETCEKSETEPERDTSSPEFDDLEMCLSLEPKLHWNSATYRPSEEQHSAPYRSSEEQHSATYRPSEEQHSATYRPSEEQHSATYRPSEEQHSATYRPSEEQHSATYRPSEEQHSATYRPSEEQHSATYRPSEEQHSATYRPAEEQHMKELLSRVESLENQIKTDSRTETEDKTGLISLVHLQARELSRLRQILRESRGLVQILVQSRTEQLKGLESLLVSREPDFTLGQTLREQLQETHRVTERLYSKISLKELPEDPDDKTELLAMRLSKELQQKDALIQSLRSKLSPDTPTENSDQSDCISYMSDGQLSNQDDDLGSETFSELQISQSEQSIHNSDQSERSFNYKSQSERSLHYNDQSERSFNYKSQSERSLHYNDQSERSLHYNDQSETNLHYSGQSERSFNYKANQREACTTAANRSLSLVTGSLAPVSRLSLLPKTFP
ncbi:hypothetical protein WMY93_024355 [Mugilogobius chulae]|uniref:Uncharacterized protein n=1 Tax=Mugilogobius chulae TaxID=88201 RepID=A0AAW0N482_9GOBI